MKSKIDRIKFLLNEVYNKLHNISEDSFHETLTSIRNMLSESKELKTYLLAHFAMSELKTFEPELTKLSKQISETFDNTITKKKLEINKISEKIKCTQNRKKLAHYHR